MKRDLADKGSFHGVLDSQELLPHGSPDKVLAEARQLVEVVGMDGGLALGPNNAFQIDVPVANVLALYDGMAG